MTNATCTGKETGIDGAEADAFLCKVSDKRRDRKCHSRFSVAHLGIRESRFSVCCNDRQESSVSVQIRTK